MEIQDILNEEYMPQWTLTLVKRFDYVNDYVIMDWEFISKAQEILWTYEMQIFDPVI